MFSEGKLRSCLADRWGVAAATVRTHNGGMNSATWFVTAGGQRWVAKAVARGSRRSFVGGLTVAGHVAASGIPAGPPVPTRDGDIVADVDGIPLALLSWVEGAGLPGTTTSDRRLIGRVLGRVGCPGAHLAVRPLASAVMYVGGVAQADCLIETYLASRTVTRAEVDLGLLTMVRFRWVVQADYFARLADARRWLVRLSAAG